MTAAWEALLEAGVPFGAARPPPRKLVPERLREAVSNTDELVAQLEEPQREALYAWLKAFRSHWPLGFDKVLGTGGARLLDVLERAEPGDPNRYIKLRRIALENLANVA
jgi:hypothetical protein